MGFRSLRLVLAQGKLVDEPPRIRDLSRQMRHVEVEETQEEYRSEVVVPPALFGFLGYSPAVRQDSAPILSNPCRNGPFRQKPPPIPV